MSGMRPRIVRWSSTDSAPVRTLALRAMASGSYGNRSQPSEIQKRGIRMLLSHARSRESELRFRESKQAQRSIGDGSARYLEKALQRSAPWARLWAAAGWQRPCSRAASRLRLHDQCAPTDDHNKTYLEVAVIKLSKKQGLMIALSALVAGMSVAGCSTQTSNEPDTSVQGEENTGKMGLNLTLSNGVLIEAFTATITGDGIASPIVRTIPVPNNGATVSALFGGLPQGDYSIELEATSVDGHSQCGGSADFTVMAQQTVGVSVPITCNTDSIRGQVTVEGELNVCPDVNFLFVAPLQTAVGGPISVEADAEDPDGDTITFVWSATDGSFADEEAAATSYTCSAPGEQTITVTINDGGNCATMHQAVVNCEPTAVCGDGNVETDKGEECEPPDGVVCSATCQDIEVECGNGVVQPGEECDPADGVTCNASCQDIECGDGVLEGQEECELLSVAPATATATGLHRNRPRLRQRHSRARRRV